MTRPQPVQKFLDALMPAMQRRASNGDSSASVGRIAAAARRSGGAGCTAATLPVCAHLDTALARPGGAADLDAVIGAIRDLLPLLCWRRRPGNDTASPNFAENHANAMVLGPGGIEDRGDVWIGFSLVAPGTRYPDHRHLPEETYLVLSPGQFRKEGRDWFAPGMGGSFFVPANALHAMRSTDDAPLFAAWALWPGRAGQDNGIPAPAG